MKIPYFTFDRVHAGLREEMQAAMMRVYDSGWFIQGRELEAFEAEYAAWNGVAHAVGLSNGLDALHLSLRALGIGPGDEVIVPSNTYIASWLAVTMAGARPVPAEPDPHTLNLSPAAFRNAISSRTRAVMPVHLYGQACAMQEITAIAQEKGLAVVEDNAQAHGAAWQGRRTGTWGQVNATSFYPGKNLGALGDAGAVTTADPGIAAQVRMLRNYGSREKYYNETQGWNCRLDELQAAVLRVKLRYLEAWTAERQQIAAAYRENLAGIPAVQVQSIAPGATHVYHIFLIRVPRRSAVQAHLLSQGISTLIHYPLPPHLQQAYAGLGYRRGDFPLAEEIADTCLSLPMFGGMTRAEIDYVCEAIHTFFR